MMNGRPDAAQLELSTRFPLSSLVLSSNSFAKTKLYFVLITRSPRAFRLATEFKFESSFSVSGNPDLEAATGTSIRRLPAKNCTAHMASHMASQMESQRRSAVLDATLLYARLVFAVKAVGVPIRRGNQRIVIYTSGSFGGWLEVAD
jgi:hypothetical protein